MSNFPQHSVYHLAQELYIEWLKEMKNASMMTDQERREAFKFVSQVAFEAAEEFSNTFSQIDS